MILCNSGESPANHRVLTFDLTPEKWTVEAVTVPLQEQVACVLLKLPTRWRFVSYDYSSSRRRVVAVIDRKMYLIGRYTLSPVGNQGRVATFDLGRID